MAQHGKRIRALRAKVEGIAPQSLPEAMQLLKETATAKFDETVEVAINLGVDPRHADQMIRGTVDLPHGTGKVVRVLVFAKGDKIAEALAAGADHAGNDDLVEKIQGGWTDFDRAVACPDVMGVVGKLGRILGPRGLMPNPKLGTVTFDVTRAVKDIKSGQAAFRVEKAGIIHVGVGKASFSADRLVDNARALLDTIQKMRPSGIKGVYIKKITVSATMGVGIRVDPATALSSSGRL
ncbi:MAG: 50S ribosomal protein L1 [Magnetococcales bacterium]|nr:50S ribosomal protein L1 [Magnetococcales bacterium]